MHVAEASIFFVDLGKSPAGSARNPILLELKTSDGVTGAGELGMAYGFGGKAGVTALAEAVQQFVLGANPFSTELIYDQLSRRTFWGLGGGPILYGAISAIDEALWDIKGKVLGRPVFELLGGACHESLRCYANGWSHSLVTPAQHEAAARRVVDSGFDALKLDPFKVDSDGVDRHPKRSVTRSLERSSIERVAAVREAIGDDVDLIVEFHGNLWPRDAIRMARLLERFDPYYIEEPVDPFDASAMREVAQSIRSPVAAGERLYTKYDFKPFLEQKAVQIIQPDLGLAGGLTDVKKIAALAETHQVYVQPHNCGSPVATAACVNLAFSIPNFLIQEIFPFWADGRYDIVEQAMEHHIENGRLSWRFGNGLGVTLNHDYLDRYRTHHIKHA